MGTFIAVLLGPQKKSQGPTFTFTFWFKDFASCRQFKNSDLTGQAVQFGGFYFLGHDKLSLILL